MPIDYGSNNVSTSGNFVAASGNFTTALTVNDIPVATGTSVSITNATDNRVLTSTNTGGGINAETNLTFNGTTLGVTGVIDIDNLRLDGNTISSTNSNGNIVLAPNGTGDVQADADTLRVGDSNAAATITTNGTGNLTINTNGGTNSGSIVIQQGSNNDIILEPNGTGQLQGSSIGNARGQNATDWQRVRSSITQVASGSSSVISGGSSNTSSGSISTVGGGYNNNSSAAFSTVGGGRNNNSSGNYSTVGGGYRNTSIGNYSTITGGKNAVASLYGEEARSSGQFNIAGDAQVRKFIMRNKSQGSSPIYLYLDGFLNELVIPENSSWFYSIKVIARNAMDIETAAYEFKGAIERSDLITIILGDTKSVIYEDNAMWDCNVSIVDDSILRIIANCDVDQNDVYWVAYAEIVQTIVPSTIPSYS